MSDDPRLAPLTEAFTAPGFGPDDENEWRMTPRQLAERVLAHLPQTQAERDGEALARLGAWGMDTVRVTLDVQSGEWAAEVLGYVFRRGTGPTIEAAVNAALGGPTDD